MSDPHAVTREFEDALCRYTGARFAVATTSCTMAIQGALAWWRSRTFISKWVDVDKPVVFMPKRSYIGVPSAVMNAGYALAWRNEEWIGGYEFFPLPVYDFARRFTSGMYRSGHMQCVSFHASKILSDTQGGAVLLDDGDAAKWLTRYFFDGRTYGVPANVDQVTRPSVHAYMSPDVAARLLWKLSVLPKHNADLPRSDYPDLSLQEAFK